MIGQKISIKIEGETHEKLTFQFTYDGTPELNTDPIEAEAGLEKSAVIPNFGGQGTLLYKVLEVTDEAETIESTFNAEKTGAWEMMQKYTPKGLDLVSRQTFFWRFLKLFRKVSALQKVTKDGKTFEEFWARVWNPNYYFADNNLWMQ